MTESNTTANPDTGQMPVGAMSGDAEKTAALDQYIEKLVPVFQTKEQLDDLRTKTAEAVGERRTWHQRVLERFRVILAEQISARGTDNEQLKKNARRIKTLLYDKDRKLYPEGDTKLRGYTMCAYVQAYAEAWIKEQKERLARLGDQNLEQFGTYRVRGMIRGQIAKIGFMVDDRNAKMSFFRRSYAFTDLVKGLPEASIAVGRLLELIRRAKSVDRYIDRHVLSGLAPGLKGRTISLDALASGEKGFCLAYVGRKHGEGLVLWYSTGTQVQAHRAFGHPGRFVEGRYLREEWAPTEWIASDKTIDERGIYVEDRRLAKKAGFLNKLWRECRKSDQTKVWEHVKEILEGKYILPIEEAVPEVVVPDVSVTDDAPAPEGTVSEADSTDEAPEEQQPLTCYVDGCERYGKSYKVAYGYAKHMKDVHGTDVESA